MSDAESLPKAAEGIGDSIIRGYSKRERRLSGMRLEPGNPAFFQNMLDRTEQIFSRQRIYATADHSGQKVIRARKVVPLLKSPPEIMRVVCISAHVPASGPAAKLSIQPMRDGSALLRQERSLDRQAWVNERLEELKKALTYDPHMIIFPEFAYPPPPDPKQGGWTIDEIDETVGRRVEFEREALRLIGSRNIFLILGSFHCLMTLYNVAVIYPWGAHRHGMSEILVSSRDETDDGIIYSKAEKVPHRVRAPVLYRKRFPARKVGEQTRVPPGLAMNLYECDFGRVMVLICSDVLDLNQFMMIIRENLLERDIDFIVIPAYNPADSFGDICSDLSALSGATVIVANAFDDAIGLTPSEIYVCGASTDQLKKSKFDEQREVATVRTGKKGKSPFKIFDIHLKHLNDARDKHYHRLQVDRVDDEPPEEIPK